MSKKSEKVIENYIGRKLHKNENVHHKNGDRSDDRIENLEIWRKQELRRSNKIKSLEDQIKLSPIKRLLQEYAIAARSVYIARNDLEEECLKADLNLHSERELQQYRNEIINLYRVKSEILDLMIQKEKVEINGKEITVQGLGEAMEYYSVMSAMSVKTE